MVLISGPSSIQYFILRCESISNCSITNIPGSRGEYIEARLLFLQIMWKQGPNGSPRGRGYLRILSTRNRWNIKQEQRQQTLFLLALDSSMRMQIPCCFTISSLSTQPSGRQAAPSSSSTSIKITFFASTSYLYVRPRYCESTSLRCNSHKFLMTPRRWNRAIISDTQVTSDNRKWMLPFHNPSEFYWSVHPISMPYKNGLKQGGELYEGTRRW